MFKLGFVEGVGGFGSAFELWFALKIQQNSRFFDKAAFKHASNDLVTVQWLACFF